MGVIELPGIADRVIAGGGGGSQIIGVMEASEAGVRVIAGGGGGSQIIGVIEGVTLGVDGGGGGGSQTIGQQAELVAPPESTIITRRDFCRSLGSLCQGIMIASYEPVRLPRDKFTYLLIHACSYIPTAHDPISPVPQLCGQG
jgi:hypothetical protein